MEESKKVPQKAKNRTITWSRNSTPGYVSEKTKTLIQEDTCTPMLIVELFTIAKIWKQSKCLSTYEWIKKMWYIQTHSGLLLSHKKEWNSAVCNNVDRPRGY